MQRFYSFKKIYSTSIVFSFMLFAALQVRAQEKESTLTLVSSVDYRTDAWDTESVDLQGNTLAVLYNDYINSGNENTLVLYDVSNPESPVEKGSISLSSSERKKQMLVKLYSNYAYVSGLEGLQVIDISDLSTPKLTYTHQCITQNAEDYCFNNMESWDMLKVGDLLFTSNDRQGISSWDVSNISSPVLLDAKGSGSFTYTFKDFAAAGNDRLIVNDGTGLQLVDYSNSADLVYIDQDDTNGALWDIQFSTSANSKLGFAHVSTTSKYLVIYDTEIFERRSVINFDSVTQDYIDIYYSFIHSEYSNKLYIGNKEFLLNDAITDLEFIGDLNNGFSNNNSSEILLAKNGFLYGSYDNEVRIYKEQLSNNGEAGSPTILTSSFSIQENLANGSSIGIIEAEDSEGDDFTFSITTGNEDGTFDLDAETGELKVLDNSNLDYEQNSSIVLEVTVTDVNDLSSTQQITINISDIFESQPPVIENQSFSIEENSPAGDVVGTVVASDPENTSLDFDITSGSGREDFEIDNSGQITVSSAGNIDFERIERYVLQVTVTDEDTVSSSADITVVILDLDDNSAPVVEDQEFSVVEGSEPGTVVGTIEAEDPDNDDLEFSISSGNTDNAFLIEDDTKEILVNNASLLDRSKILRFELSVVVSDGQNESSFEVLIGLTEGVLANDRLRNSEIRTYPNPSKGEFQIEILNNEIRSLTVQLMDLSGKILLDEKIRRKLNSINVSTFEDGAYYLILTDQRGYMKSDMIMISK